MEGRFYEAEFPQVDEIVVVRVDRIVDMGAYVSLLEYNGREGMMLLSELSKRRIRSVAKLLRVGRTEVCMVLRADNEKGYIDLSKRRVEPEDKAAKDEWFAKAKAVHGIMRHVAGMHDVDVTELCKKVSWPLYRNHQDAHEALRKHINEEINVWDEIDFSQPGQDLSHLEDKLKADIETDLRRRLITQALRMRSKINVSCSEFEGIDAIKAALMKAFEASTEECEVKVKLIAHPLFMLTCQTRDKQLGLATLETAMHNVRDAIVASKGEYEEKLAPELIGNDQKEEEEEGEGDEEAEEGSSEEEQDETMGNIDDKAMADLMERTKDLKEDEDDD